MTANPIFDFSSFPVITTPRLRLRQLTHADADGIITIFGDPEMMRFLKQPLRDTPEKAIELIDWLADIYQKQESVNWGITPLDDDRLIGMCGMYDWERSDRRVDIGYQIIKLHWGKGYASEAARAMIGWCFENLDLHRIQADCTDGNIASEKVMLKCGFKVEGLWRESCWEHGRFVDIKQMGLLRREFDAQMA
ncbi:MAG: GNAT family N-acetyltransferase [Chloroflexota bacterium]